MAYSILLRGNDYEFTLEMDGTYGDVPIRYEPGVLEEIYAKVLNNQPFQACEFSLSNYTMMRDRGADWMAAIPVFANRDFRHSIIWVRKDSDLNSPEQLRGKRVGVRDYTMTAAVWLRGTLIDEFDTDWRDINWYANSEQRFPALDGVPLELGDGDPGRDAAGRPAGRLHLATSARSDAESTHRPGTPARSSEMWPKSNVNISHAPASTRSTTRS